MSFQNIFTKYFTVFSLLVIIGLIPQTAHSANVKALIKGDAIKWNGTVIDVSVLKKFYRSKRYKGIWTGKQGLNKNGKQLIAAMQKAGSDGLETGDYLSGLPKNLNTLKGNDLAAAELLLSQSFYRFSRDLFTGRTTPAVSEPDIVISRKSIDRTALLKLAASKGPDKAINQLRPKHKQYAQLRQLLAKTNNKSQRRKIIINMERWRWLPSSLGKSHVLVNQAAFTVQIHKNGKLVDTRRVIIGKPFHKTPMFSHKISSAEFNPTWTVPRSIAGNEILPKLRKNPNYLAGRNFNIHTSWDKDAPIMNPNSIDWNSVRAKNFPYRIVQQPGEKNALGYVKFLFPNKFKVYMHDTPSRKLFSQQNRAFSHGCIRVEKPLEFASILLGMKSSKIDSLLKTGKTQRVKIRKGIPVHLTYFTVWFDAKGKVSFHKDIYKRDVLVGNILFGRA